MGLLDNLKKQAKGVAAQVNMRDGGKTYGSTMQQQPQLPQRQMAQQMPTRYEDGSIKMGGVGVSPGYNNMQLGKTGPIGPQPNIVPRNGYGMPQQLNPNPVDPQYDEGMGFVGQPYGQGYEDSENMLQQGGYNAQTSAHGNFYQGPQSNQDLLRYLTRR
jgi:hypothetical protein